MSPNIVVGRQNDNGDVPQADIALLAEDILPKHCIFHRSATGGPTMLCPFPDAAVTKNGNMLKEKGELCPGDVIGLGQTYLFLFKDPLMHKVIDVNKYIHIYTVLAIIIIPVISISIRCPFFLQKGTQQYCSRAEIVDPPLVV